MTTLTLDEMTTADLSECYTDLYRKLKGAEPHMVPDDREVLIGSVGTLAQGLRDRRAMGLTPTD